MKPLITKLFTCFLLLSILSCKKKIGDGSPFLQPDIVDSTQNPKDKTAKLNKEIALILEMVYKNDSARIEVNIAIFSGYYEDERVYLYDLLYPGTTPIYNADKFKKISQFTGVFSRLFFDAMAEGNYPVLSEILSRPVPKKWVASDASIITNAVVIPKRNELIPISPGTLTTSIYFPYSENFSSATLAGVNPTIVAATADTDVATGREPYSCVQFNILSTCYRNATVNDDYAATKPVHIITDGAEFAAEDKYPEPVANMINRAYHGWSRLTKQLDKLISLTGNGGGSEMKVCRVNGYLEMKDDHIDNFKGDIVTIHYKRGDIRKKKWKRIYSVWEPNWNYQDTEQIYAVYEEDNKGEASFNGTLNTTLSVPGKSSTKINGEIGFKISVKTQDELVTQRKLDRNSFFKSAGVNQGYGYYSDANDFLSGALNWPIYDGGSIWSFTMPIQVY